MRKIAPQCCFTECRSQLLREISTSVGLAYIGLIRSPIEEWYGQKVVLSFARAQDCFVLQDLQLIGDELGCLGLGIFFQYQLEISLDGYI